MGTKFKVPSLLLPLSCISIITAALAVVPVLVSSSALPQPAQPVKIIFPRTDSSEYINEANSTFYINASVSHSNAFNFSSSTEKLEFDDSESESSNFNETVVSSPATPNQKREIGKLPLEKLFSNLTTNKPTLLNNVAASILPMRRKNFTLTSRGGTVKPALFLHHHEKQVSQHFAKINASSLPLAASRIDPKVELPKRKLPTPSPPSNSTLHSSSTTTATTTTSAPVRKINSTVPPTLRRPVNTTFNTTLLSKRPSPVFQRRTSNDTSEADPDPEEVIRQALINHTLMHGGEEDLDRLVFSQLPEGSKLILRSVKIVKTDENGDTVEDEDDDNASMAWDVTIANATDNIFDAEETDPEDDGEDDDDEYDEDDSESPKDSDKNVNKNDLLSAGSHQSHVSANYKSYGTNHRQKDKSKKYHHGTDHGKSHKNTLTDTDGVKVKNYDGKEKGLTDFNHAHGNAQSNEGGRYKDSKKKNKGRKVTGFKRVYHKEEFQRTEHFYDDEEAKRIAENYSMSDHKEKSNHGEKGDDRKYHGVRNEHLDGKKVKNEYGTKVAYNKGQQESHKDSEKHVEGGHHGNSKNSRYASPLGNGYQENKSYHPNHNYKGSYSNSAPILHPTPIASSPDSDRPNEVHKVPVATSFTVTEYIQPESTEDSAVVSHLDPTQPDPPSHAEEEEEDPSIMSSPEAPLEKPEEMKVFFSPRERNIPLENEIHVEETPYAPNFGPPPHNTHHHQPELPFIHGHNNHYRRPHRPRISPSVPDSMYGNSPLRFMDTPFFNKIGNISAAAPHPHGQIVENSIYQETDRYPNNQHASTTVPNQANVIIDPVPAVYSTIVKVLPTQFYNYTDFHKAATNIVAPDSNLISIDKVKVNEIVISTSPRSNSNHRHNHPIHGAWLSRPYDNEQESQQHPNHNYGQSPTYRGGRKRLSPTLLARLHHRRRHRPVHSQRPGPPSGSPSQAAYTNNNMQTISQGPSGQPSNPAIFKSRRPPMPTFMNGLMDSVANFFSKIG